MGRLKVWLNQKIAQLLGDVQDQKTHEDPSPERAGCRIFFVVSLLLGFSLLLVYDFFDAPDVRVVQIHRVKPGDKNRAFPSCFLNDRNATNCKKWSKAKFPVGIPVSCPCTTQGTNSSAPWKDFVKFYVLHENSTDWNMSFTAYATQGFYPSITVPDDSVPLGNESIVPDTKSLTAEIFCNLSSLWPFAENSTTSAGVVDYVEQNVKEDPTLLAHCVWMATLLFNSSNSGYEDRSRSTKFLNTPSLLSREELNTLVAQLARDSVLTRRLALDMALSLNTGEENFRRFYNALAHLLTGLLDREKMDPSQSYVYGARDLSLTLSSNQFYDENAKVWYLGDDSGPIFLQPEVDWEAYLQHCYPEYCEVVKPMGKARQLYWVFGILGGVVTIILAVVTTVLWPCTAMLLLWMYKRKPAATGDPERPKEHMSLPVAAYVRD